MLVEIIKNETVGKPSRLTEKSLIIVLKLISMKPRGNQLRSK